MSWIRFLEIFRLELRRNLTRPLFWILIALVFLISYGLAGGDVRIGSGDSTVGGTKAWITSEFAVTQILSTIDFLLFIFFFAVIAGLPVLRDEEDRVHELLHSTPLRPAEYVWGKFLAVLSVYAIVVALHLCLSIFFNHAGPAGDDAEFLGPFVLGNYLRPALWFTLPAMVFITAVCFLLGTVTRKPILVFLLPVILLGGCGFFLWTWSPSWLDPNLNRLMMMLDPSGFRWFSETYMKVDRGVEFYNQVPVPITPGFALNRIVFVLLGLLAVFYTQLRFTRGLRGAGGKRSDLQASARTGAALRPDFTRTPRLFALGMRSGRVHFLPSLFEVAWIEMRGLIRSPGLYLFIPVSVLMVMGNGVLRTGPFDTPLLFTSGQMAAGAWNWLVTLTCLLLLFYTVEALVRERLTGLAQIHYSTPVRTTAWFLGKVLGASAIGLAMLATAFLACAVAALAQGRAEFELKPFLILWGLLMLPTFLVWVSFVTALFALTRNRMTCYALGLGLLVLTAYRQLVSDEITWASNWTLWNAVTWTDLAPFELDWKPLLLNRLLFLSLSVALVALAARCFPRREFDATRTLERLKPASLLRAGRALLPYAALPLLLFFWLHAEVEGGFQGDALEKARKDYWRRNVATFTDSLVPDVLSVDLDLSLHPEDRSFTSSGTYTLINHHDEPLRQIPVTPGLHWKETRWSLNGEPFTPENRAGLAVFQLEAPLDSGGQLTLGFACSGRYPDGATKNGGGTGTFILPSAVMLTSFSPQFTPVIGYLESVGVDEENQYDAKEFPDDFQDGLTHSLFGNDRPFTLRLRIEGPADFVMNSVGTLVSESVTGDRKTVVWESDHPVNFFNVVAGRYVVRRGEGTAIYHHPRHAYNLDEMLEALDAARLYYSDWFHPFPWKELKLTEFPGLSTYAQGFPTNITFSENIGFLTESDPRSNTAFLVVAHESAHQWWGNLLVPGEGPSGNILSEGLSHYSTALLFEAVKGDSHRIEFLKGIENRYGEGRRVDSERPLIRIDGSRHGDTTCIYDKGGFAVWMLQQQMGRQRCLAGIRAFIDKYRSGPDHPVLADFLDTLREYSAEPEAYDAFVDQWFRQVVVPEYRLNDVRRVRLDGFHEVTATVENAGTSTMPVEIAAWSEDRFDDDGNRAPGFREERTMVVLGPGETRPLTLRCDFEPQRLIVDPDARVLQLKRELAVFEF